MFLIVSIVYFDVKVIQSLLEWIAIINEINK